jgi:hypothetical protein
MWPNFVLLLRSDPGLTQNIDPEAATLSQTTSYFAAALVVTKFERNIGHTFVQLKSHLDVEQTENPEAVFLLVCNPSMNKL